MVLLSGEAGIGKSRRTAALLDKRRKRAAHALALFLFAAAYRYSALYPIIGTDGTRRRLQAQQHSRATARQTEGGAVTGDE